MKKIKIAFVKYGGMTSGGSEKLLQIIAANLPKDRFDVTYFYTDMVDSVGPKVNCLPTDASRLLYMEKNGVKLVRCEIKAIDLTSPFYTWVNTDFFRKFNESDFDILQTCRGGHKEFPFVMLKKIPIVDIIALSAGVDNQYNISRVFHICNWSANGWIKNGGDASRVRIVSLPIATEADTEKTLRSELGINEDVFIYGMHQRPADDIFSPIPLAAYASIETEKTLYILMGGGEKYKTQAKELGIKNIIFLPASGDASKIFAFLRTLNAYAHGRKDGEVNSQAMAEAMHVGLPIVSHFSTVNNGHVECIGEAGKVVKGNREYQNELLKLMNDKNYFLMRREASFKRFKDNYELEGQIKKYTSLYEEVYKNPFPNPFKRFFSSLHYTQNIRVLMVAVYRKLKYSKYTSSFFDNAA